MIEQVRPHQLPAWLATKSDARPLVLDVREPGEVKASSVKAEGFELVHIPMNEIPGRLGQLDPGRAVAVLCHHGTRSQRVAMFLQHHGFEDLANIAGGIEAWSQELDPGVPRY